MCTPNWTWHFIFGQEGQLALIRAAALMCGQAMDPNVDAGRRQRYEAKQAHAQRTLSEAVEWLGKAPVSRVHLMACYKAFQETVEALTDLVAMRVKDRGRVPMDDYSNIDLLRAQGDLSQAAAAALAKANGLRNRLVHEYNGLWDDVAIDAIAGLAGGLQAVLQEVAAWY